MELTDNFELSGIRLGTTIVLTGCHVLGAMAPVHMKQPRETPLPSAVTIGYDDTGSKPH
ncbi:hypothetical protein ACIA8O_36825 [Kitasatospora sp. NPDC051853]|uniref:hypothetical protein n=1 Tax=Kitasatospora sp. NPDC051853 TaxID=3364058 RepID=UPI0037B3A6B0